MSVSAVAGASNYASIAFDQESLTPEGMMLYLSTRLEEVDGQINTLFGEAEKLRKKSGRNLARFRTTRQAERGIRREDALHAWGARRRMKSSRNQCGD